MNRELLERTQDVHLETLFQMMAEIHHFNPKLWLKHSFTDFVVDENDDIECLNKCRKENRD